MVFFLTRLEWHKRRYNKTYMLRVRSDALEISIIIH